MGDFRVPAVSRSVASVAQDSGEGDAQVDGALQLKVCSITMSPRRRWSQATS